MKTFREYLEEDSKEENDWGKKLYKVRMGKSKLETLKLPKGFSIKIKQVKLDSDRERDSRNSWKFSDSPYLYHKSELVSGFYYDDGPWSFRLASADAKYDSLSWFRDVTELVSKINKNF